MKNENLLTVQMRMLIIINRIFLSVALVLLLLGFLLIHLNVVLMGISLGTYGAAGVMTSVILEPILSLVRNKVSKIKGYSIISVEQEANEKVGD